MPKLCHMIVISLYNIYIYILSDICSVQVRGAEGLCSMYNGHPSGPTLRIVWWYLQIYISYI